MAQASLTRNVGSTTSELSRLSLINGTPTVTIARSECIATTRRRIWSKHKLVLTSPNDDAHLKSPEAELGRHDSLVQAERRPRC